MSALPLCALIASCALLLFAAIARLIRAAKTPPRRNRRLSPAELRELLARRRKPSRKTA